MPGERLLLSTVGTSAYEQTRFVLADGRETRAATSPEALVQLLDFDTVVLTHTAAVREETDYLNRIRESCSDQNIGITLVEVPLVEGRADVDQILDRVGANLADSGVEAVVLDITHAFRSLQLALYTAAVHLDALEVVSLDTIYYAENAGHGGTAPVLDLTYLSTLMEWHHALRSFRTQGTLGPLQGLLAAKRDRVFRGGDEHSELVQLDSALGSVASYLDAGLPLETGVAARYALETLDSFDDRDFIGPEGAFLDPLADQLKRFVVDQADVSEKSDIELTTSELSRQRELVRFYVETGREWHALECARELFLTRLLYERYGRDVEWLNTDIRHDGRRRLTGAVKRYRSNDASPPEALRVWDKLSQSRNTHAHAGFDPNETPTGKEVQPVIETVCERLNDETFWRKLVNVV